MWDYENFAQSLNEGTCQGCEDPLGEGPGRTGVQFQIERPTRLVVLCAVCADRVHAESHAAQRARLKAAVIETMAAFGHVIEAIPR